MSDTDGSKMSTFGPKFGAVPAGPPSEGHAQGPEPGAPASRIVEPPEELPLPPPLLELELVARPEFPELLPEPVSMPASGEPSAPPGVEEQAPAAAAGTARENRTAHLVGACA